MLNLLLEKGRLPEQEAIAYFRQVVSAVAHCHHYGVFHRDIKPENILVGRGRVVLSDFGSALCTTARPPMSTTPCGSISNVAPELYAVGMGSADVSAALSPDYSMLEAFVASPPTQGDIVAALERAGAAGGVRADASVGAGGQPRGESARGYNAASCDAWSLGVLLFVMLAGHPPWSEPSQWDDNFSQLLRGTFRFPRQFSGVVCSLLKGLFELDPKRRITVTGILSHPLLSVGTPPVPSPRPGFGPLSSPSFTLGEPAAGSLGSSYGGGVFMAAAAGGGGAADHDSSANSGSAGRAAEGGSGAPGVEALPEKRERRLSVAASTTSSGAAAVSMAALQQPRRSVSASLSSGLSGGERLYQEMPQLVVAKSPGFGRHERRSERLALMSSEESVDGALGADASGGLGTSVPGIGLGMMFATDDDLEGSCDSLSFGGGAGGTAPAAGDWATPNANNGGDAGGATGVAAGGAAGEGTGGVPGDGASGAPGGAASTGARPAARAAGAGDFRPPPFRKRLRQPSIISETGSTGDGDGSVASEDSGALEVVGLGVGIGVRGRSALSRQHDGGDAALSLDTDVLRGEDYMEESFALGLPPGDTPTPSRDTKRVRGRGASSADATQSYGFDMMASPSNMTSPPSLRPAGAGADGAHTRSKSEGSALAARHNGKLLHPESLMTEPPPPRVSALPCRRAAAGPERRSRCRGRCCPAGVAANAAGERRSGRTVPCTTRRPRLRRARAGAAAAVRPPAASATPSARKRSWRVSKRYSPLMPAFAEC